MNKTHFALRAITLFAFTLAISMVAHAQATRTWVSGVGDDVNPCSRTAPCKTFAGAISKTAIGGEIDAMDFGGFGSITITKSITIDGGSAFASILAGGVNAVNVNIGAGNANDPERRATLRRLSLNGTGTSGTIGQRISPKGVNVIAASVVHVENCYIQNFTQEGVNASLAESGTFVYVKDTNIQNCTTGVNVTTTTGFDVVSLNNVRVEKMSGNGLTIGTHGHAHVRNSVFVSNGGDGVAITAAVADGTANLESCFIASNGGVGLRNGSTGSTIDLSNTSILQNIGVGIASNSAAAGGGVNSHGNNQISGNAGGGTVPNPVGQQ
ncbi:MAG TPA: hypothetical protein VKB86_16130 [Pyrinomonadaceae bacterium]|nr:hypothetical protein [Pyrinomonadaceae bacterium]